MNNSQRISSKVDGIIEEVIFTFLGKAEEKEGTSFLILRAFKLFANILQTFLIAPAPGM